MLGTPDMDGRPAPPKSPHTEPDRETGGRQDASSATSWGAGSRSRQGGGRRARLGGRGWADRERAEGSGLSQGSWSQAGTWGLGERRGLEPL